MQIDPEEPLLCPACGEDYLHQQGVRILQRFREDGDGTEVVVLSAHRVQMQPLAAAEIPGRRDSIEISFTCEHCDAIPALWISQHKGRTFLEWAPTASALLEEQAQGWALRV